MNRQFCGVYDALDFLENEWPMHGKHQAQAVRACRAALRHPRYAEWARNSFIAACIEASFACSDMPEEPGRRDRTYVSLQPIGAGSVKRVAAAGTSSRKVCALALGHFARRNF
ncbi:DUF982 domain-containing protein [Sinorhizobium meliloti]|nr:DUF982 domain-containing protein [Sinorhizobium meliloti]